MSSPMTKQCGVNWQPARLAERNGQRWEDCRAPCSSSPVLYAFIMLSDIDRQNARNILTLSLPMSPIRDVLAQRRCCLLATWQGRLKWLACLTWWIYNWPGVFVLQTDAKNIQKTLIKNRFSRSRVTWVFWKFNWLIVGTSHKALERLAMKETLRFLSWRRKG
jgi:hypothetical protein